MRPHLLPILFLMFSLVAGCEQPLTRDAEGFPHGTGDLDYAYQSGAVKLRENYKNGELIHSRWYKPDGTLLKETYWHNGDGEGVYLRDDGTIKTRMTYVHGIAEGEATNYDESGHSTKVMYRSGRPVEPTTTENRSQLRTP